MTLSPSREEARERRHVELRSALVHWNRTHPRRVGIKGPGQRLPDIPLEPVPTSGYRLPSAAAGSARNLAPTSPDPEEAYSPPLDAGEWWTNEDQRAVEELMAHEPMVNRLSPLVTPPLLSVPTVIGEEAVGLAPARVGAPPLTISGSLIGVVETRAMQMPTVESKETVGLAPACVKTPPLPTPEAWEELKLFECLK